jgi:hypothetical protein
MQGLPTLGTLQRRKESCQQSDPDHHPPALTHHALKTVVLEPCPSARLFYTSFRNGVESRGYIVADALLYLDVTIAESLLHVNPAQ